MIPPGQRLEDAFRRRLVYDGEGRGDDKRLMAIIKDITVYNNPSSPESEEKAYHALVKNISLAIGASVRCEQMLNISDQAAQTVNQFLDETTQKIADLTSKIADLKLELEFVEKLKSVNIHQDRHSIRESMSKLEDRKRELSSRIFKQKQNIMSLGKMCEMMYELLDDDQDLTMDGNNG